MTTDLAADLDELDAMIGALGKEKGLPHGVWPQHVRDERDPVPQGHEERHRPALEWRRKLIAELKGRLDWIRRESGT
jgi:hypothetical protein